MEKARAIAPSLRNNSIQSFLRNIEKTYKYIRSRELLVYVIYHAAIILNFVNIFSLLTWSFLRQNMLYLVYTHSMLFITMIYVRSYNHNSNLPKDYIWHMNNSLKPCHLSVHARKGAKLELRSTLSDEKTHSSLQL